MIYPSVDELTGDKYNRYILCIAIAKGARQIAQEKKNDKEAAVKDFRDDKTAKKPTAELKPVQTAIDRFYNDKYKIILP